MLFLHACNLTLLLRNKEINSFYMHGTLTLLLRKKGATPQAANEAPAGPAGQALRSRLWAGLHFPPDGHHGGI